MSEIIKINTDRLKVDASDIQGQIRAMQSKIADLRAHNAALDAMWDGESSETFKAAFESDIQALEQMIGSLLSMNKYERNAREKYDECESRVGEIVDQIKVR